MLYYQSRYELYDYIINIKMTSKSNKKIKLVPILLTLILQIFLASCLKTATTTGQTLKSAPLTLFHFNDVYDLIPATSQPKAGAAYFKSLLDRYKSQSHSHNNSLTLFSGDVFSPSLLSSEYQGKNMLKPLNSFGIDVACFGNHEFDYSIEKVFELVNETNFSWLNSNVYDTQTGDRLAEGLEFLVFQRQGYKIGVFSLAEEEWVHTVIPEYLDRIVILPFVDFAKSMVKKLRGNLECDFVIALTHMMNYNDIKLAEEVQGIDLILGGHDHYIMHQKVNDTVIVKSGSDFQNFNQIQIQKLEKIEKGNSLLDLSQNAKPGEKIYTFKTSKYYVKCTLLQVNHQKMQILPDPELHSYINSLTQDFNRKKKRSVLYTPSPIDLRFETIRAYQSPYINFIAELYRWDREADCAIKGGNLKFQYNLEIVILLYSRMF